jgi:hypothetical protein
LNVVLKNFIIHNWFRFFFFFFFFVDGNEIECNAESDDSDDKCEYTLIDEDENVDKPKRGMAFSSLQEIFLYYRRVAMKVGCP